MQLVFEFVASDLRPIVQAIERVVGSVACIVSCVAKGSHTYVPSHDTLSSVAAKLATGEVSAFSLHPESGLIRYALALAPFFENEKLSLHFGTIEYVGDDYQDTWNVTIQGV